MLWETARRCGGRLERKWEDDTADETREGRRRAEVSGKEEPARRTLTGTAAERERRRDGAIGDGAESARRRPAGREPKVSLAAEWSRAAADARKASRPANAAALAAGAIERRMRERRMKGRVWGGDSAMVVAGDRRRDRGAGFRRGLDRSEMRKETETMHASSDLLPQGCV